MGYAGTTSSSPVFPRLVTQPIAGGRVFQLVSTELAAVVGTSDYLSESPASKLGMKGGDRMELISGLSTSTAWIITSHGVLAVGSTYVSLSTGVSISS